MKGQFFEIMGFVILAIAIIAVIMLLRTTSIGGFGKTILNLAERHESERVNSGANALFSMTESKSGKTIQELVGIAAYTGNDTVDMGPAVGEINIPEEITWRLDEIYGKDHWYMKVPYPDIEVGIQIIFVVDTSSSLCDDVANMAKELPKLIDTLRSVGKKVTATIYLLEGGSPCCEIIPDKPNQPYPIDCTKFPQSNYLRCGYFSGLTCSSKPGSFYGDRSEDWGDGIACAIEAGPIEGWEKYTVKVVVPLSDELPEGSECQSANMCCASNPTAYTEQHNSLQRGTDAAKKAGALVFPIKADPGNGCCPACNCQDGGSCSICMIDKQTGQTYKPFTKTQCDCSDLLSKYMTEISTATGGSMYDLAKGTDMAAALKDVIEKVSPKRTQSLEAGNKQGYELAQLTKTSVRSVNFPVPVAVVGIYTTANIYEWS